jgi:hypothetical protein
MRTKARPFPAVLLPSPALCCAFAAPGLLMILVGCSSKKEEIPPAEVKAVTAYGMTLDDSATPKQVAFVLLRSIADDVQAAQAHDTEKQKAALRITHSLGAFIAIEKGLQRVSKEDPIAIQISQDRDAGLYEFTRLWAPTVSHYIRSFDTDFETAARRMRISNQTAITVQVLYDVCHDPAKPTEQTATIDIELTRENGGVLSYWRVARVGFRYPMGTRTRPAPATQAAAASQKSG